MSIPLSRLSPYNISDVLTRAGLYKEVRAGNPSWPEYQILPDETLRPELVSLRHYGTDELKWVICIVTGLDDLREEISSGTVTIQPPPDQNFQPYDISVLPKIKLPPVVWIRERIRYYSEANSNE